MKKIYRILCLGLFLLAACDKLVEVEDPANQIGTSQIFNDIQTANAALAGLYVGLRDQSVLSGGSYYGINPLLDSYTDNLDCFYNNQAVMEIYQNQLLETNSTISYIWKTAYQEIYHANSIIYGAENSGRLSEAETSQIKGEAIFIRSLIYYYLQQLFNDIPYTKSIDYEYNRSLSKKDGATLLDQLETDLKEASDLLKDDYRDAERIYPNRKAAQLLLARIYLHQGEWSQAQFIVEEIMESPLYQFQPDISEVFHKSSRNILWQLKPQNSGDAVKEASFYFFTGAAPNSYTLTGDLVNTFADNDLRKQAWMAAVTYNGNTWYRPYKYKNLSGSNTNEYSVILRLEEVYFIMAEALAMQNRVDDAMIYLNATRERAGLTALSSLSAEEFIDELLAEKRREFFTEFGHRFIDLKRMGRLEELGSLKPNWQEYKQRWPVPQSELMLNPNMAPQNPGY